MESSLTPLSEEKIMELYMKARDVESDRTFYFVRLIEKEHGIKEDEKLSEQRIQELYMIAREVDRSVYMARLVEKEHGIG